MSILTRARDAVTGTVQSIAAPVIGIGSAITGGPLGNLGGTLGIFGAGTGLTGLLGGGVGGPLPSPGSGGSFQSGESGLGGYQNNLQNLMQAVGSQPQVSATSPNNGGLI